MLPTGADAPRPAAKREKEDVAVPAVWHVPTKNIQSIGSEQASAGGAGWVWGLEGREPAEGVRCPFAGCRARLLGNTVTYLG